MDYLPYEEPGITVVLPLTSFLLLLNVIRHVLDRFLYCGIIGEILIGVVWGLPVGGASWLTEGTQKAIQEFGYLGLIGLVFEGGLSTDLSLLRKSALLSISVATIGLLTPIALSFILLVLPFPSSAGTVFPTPLAAFSAGASLCSTSLGTTFTILCSANMQHTRAGVVLVGAAMMDDVVGLVMVQIVTTLGSGNIEAWPIARPITASFGLFLVTLAITPFLLKPIWTWLKLSPRVHRSPQLGFVFATALLIIYVTTASFVDGSVLFAAFIAGGLVKYLWGVAESDETPNEPVEVNTPSTMYEHYYKPMMEYLLVPFFFASIGFSIPIRSLFTNSIIWRGLIYSILMMLAKITTSSVIYFSHYKSFFSLFTRSRKPPLPIIVPLHYLHPRNSKPTTLPQPLEPPAALPMHRESIKPKPPHLIALLVGFSMTARGEIGFLIASLSQSSGNLSLKSKEGTAVVDGEEVFLVVICAVMICTIVGPVAVGVIVRRLRSEGRVGDGVWL